MKKYTYYLCIVALATVLIYSCAPSTSADKAPAVPGIELSNMDTTANPASDFFRYVNGTWLDNTEIPADRSRWGSFDELRKKSSKNTLAVLEAATAGDKYGKGTDQWKAATFYKSAMDTVTRDEQGVTQLQPYFDMIDNIKSVTDLQRYNEHTIAYGGRTFFDFAVFPDLRNSNYNAAYLSSGSIGLPERDYYVKEDADSKNIREKYVSHVERMLGFLGKEKRAAMAQSVMNIETKLAKNMMTKEKRRNPLNQYNKRSMEELQALVPSIEWRAFFKNIGAGDMDTIIVLDIAYIEGLEAVIQSCSIEDLKNYALWNDFNGATDMLTTEIENANFDFYGKELRGAEQQRPRWERSLGMASGVVGEAIGKLYVDEHFPPEAKTKAADMIENLRAAFEDRINGLEWMTDETKVKAQQKLKNITVKIGYPDKWKDYGELDIKSAEDGGSYFSNLIAASKWGFQEDLDKLGKEVDKTEWGMSPQTVNAYYNPLNNEIVFPAAILQPPFYNYQADEAVNYGGIGAVIGHEISHGFDDQGSRFDAEGNMTNWWTDDDRDQFESRNQKLIDQFDAYEALPGVFVNGQFTLGENIGDLGGIHAAYDGLQKHWAANGKPEPIDGFTAEQRFFMSWATIWRTKMRDKELQNRIKTDPHSPGLYRAIGPVSNMPAFYEAFGVKEGDALYRSQEDRVNIW
jgi:predicted metalloendopeptidase